MKFHIEEPNGTGMTFDTEEEFFEELKRRIEEAEIKGAADVDVFIDYC